MVQCNNGIWRGGPDESVLQEREFMCGSLGNSSWLKMGEFREESDGGD